MGLQGQQVKEKKHKLDGIISDKVYEEIREAELNKYMKDDDELDQELKTEIKKKEELEIEKLNEDFKKKKKELEEYEQQLIAKKEK